jgi:MoaA/NifB/PqqE/SkfB family radical SAM enzyme
MNVDLTWMEKDFFVIIPSFKCNAMCDHCQHSCSMEREEQMDIDTFCSCIDQALDAGWKKICLSGGEPFLLLDYLEHAGRICKARQAELIVQTNGFWGRDRSKAKDILKKIGGITAIGFSIDKCHIEQIGIDPLLNAINAATESGIKNISISVSYQTSTEFEVLTKTFQEAFPGIQVVGWPICPIGRAKEHPELRVNYYEYQWDRLQRNCDSQVRMIPIVHPNGDLHPCYRTVMVLEDEDPLILGNVNRERISDIISNVDNDLYLFIIVYGGGGLGYLLEGSSQEGILMEKHQGVCHFCHNVLSSQATVDHLKDQLDSGMFNDHILGGLDRLQNGWKDRQFEKKEKILVCNGCNCSRKHNSYPIFHYLSNRLVEHNVRYQVDIELIDCLKSCDTGQNIYLEKEKRMITHVDMASIDALVKEISSGLTKDV